MTFNSGPMIAVDDKGRAVVCGYVISGHTDYGFRAATTVPLTAEEVAAGCKQILWNDHLGYLLRECKEQLDLRSQLPLGACGDVPLSKTLMGLDEPGTEAGG